ncbi:MAG: 4-hydroxythreonine-4-phosphate dehydrogenase PdxA, partial [Deltaproteobacteria bacterium]
MTESLARPILALTMGDPVGVGPEIIVKTLADARIYQVCRPLVVGDLPACERARMALDPALKIHLADRPGAGRYQSGTLDLMALSQLELHDLQYGRPTPASGAAMVGYILAAIDLALAQKVAGLVTAPISKIAMRLSGYDYPGHTELLAEKTDTPEYAMMLAGGDFRVVLATIHCALSEVPQRLTRAGLVRLFHLTSRALDRDFGLGGVPLGVAALNPHASEEGLFSHEEEEII